MIAPSHFTRIADEHAVDAKTVERDYVLTHVIGAISQQPRDHGLIFKGGTALRLCYLENYRYSADLDFSLLEGASIERALEEIRTSLEQIQRQIGFPQLAIAADGKSIEYTGPLGRSRKVKLDIAGDERVEGSATRPLLPRYGDQPNVQIDVYSLQEIAAEKLRCVIQRLQTRDPFDLHELLVNQALDVESIWPIFERKARHKQIDPARFAGAFEKRLPEWKARWEQEMNEYLPGDPPAFDGLARAVRRALRAQLRKGG